MIQINNLTKKFGEKEAVNIANLHIATHSASADSMWSAKTKRPLAERTSSSINPKTKNGLVEMLAYMGFLSSFSGCKSTIILQTPQ